MMRGMMLALALLAPPSAARAYAVPTDCGVVLGLYAWQSRSERGSWVNTVEVNHYGSTPILVSLRYTGPGTSQRRSFRMAAGGQQRVALGRTPSWQSAEQLRTGTTLTCTAAE